MAVKLNRRIESSTAIKHVKLNRLLIEDHWNVINLDSSKCFVCDCPFKKGQKKTYVDKRNGVLLFRHDKCNCNSNKWYRKFGNCKKLIKRGGL